MVTLAANTAAQNLYLTLKESRKLVATFTNYLIEFQNVITNEKFYLIANVTNEYDRYTHITIGTDTDDAVNGSIEMTGHGQYRYVVRGQNSTTNLDPTDASVIGIVERGKLQLSHAVTHFNEDSNTLPNEIIYYNP